jgi:uncharacterized coiled-coil protein SlyX
MLSYPWKYQKLFIWLKEQLQAQGYTVWMDIDQMSQSVLEAMAGAVENAAVIVFCLASAYKESEACRTEAEYSYNLRKALIPVKPEAGYRPDGWLGALVGNKLYFDFSKGEETHDEKFGQLLKEIERHGVAKAGDAPPPASASETKTSKSSNDASADALRKQLAEQEQAMKELQRQLHQAKTATVSSSAVVETKQSTSSSANHASDGFLSKLEGITFTLASLESQLNTLQSQIAEQHSAVKEVNSQLLSVDSKVSRINSSRACTIL